MGIGKYYGCFSFKYVSFHYRSQPMVHSIQYHVLFSPITRDSIFSSDPSIDQLSENLFLKLFEVTTATFNDNEKVRMNAVRIYGNLLRLINSNQIELRKWQKVCCEAIQKLSEQAKIATTGSNVKVKWNACYAIGNFMKNSVIFDLDVNDFCWQVRKHFIRDPSDKKKKRNH